MHCYPFIHSDDQSCEPVENLQLVCARNCPAQPVEWHWPDKIPIGKVSLLIGDPGLGKSLVALDIAARIEIAIRAVFARSDERTGDLGGTATTNQFVDAVLSGLVTLSWLRAIGRRHKILN